MPSFSIVVVSSLLVLVAVAAALGLWGRRVGISMGSTVSIDQRAVCPIAVWDAMGTNSTLQELILRGYPGLRHELSTGVDRVRGVVSISLRGRSLLVRAQVQELGGSIYQFPLKPCSGLHLNTEDRCERSSERDAILSTDQGQIFQQVEAAVVLGNRSVQHLLPGKEVSQCSTRCRGAPEHSGLRGAAARQNE